MAGADVDVGTELRLGLPGGGAEAAKAGKRGYEDTIDLKLTLPTGGMQEDSAGKPEPAADKAKRPAEAAAADPEKPPAPKYVCIDSISCAYASLHAATHNHFVSYNFQ